jgi:SAM-dependent methyltransferase
MRSTVARHLRRGFVRAVFVVPGSDDQTPEIVEGDGAPPDAAQTTVLLDRATAAAKAGRVKQTWILDGRTKLVVDARHGAGKVVEADADRVAKQMGGKPKALRPDTSEALLRIIGITNADGTMSAKHAKKYKQVSHFVELCKPVWQAVGDRRALTVDAPLRVLDLGCGNAYLTFVMAEALRLAEIPARLFGVDRRDDVVVRAQARARQLGWDHVRFACATIDAADDATLATGLGGPPDVVVALHACDTATDDALALAISLDVAAVLAAPCCQHEVAAQLAAAATDPLASAFAKQGLLRQDLGALLTDAVRIDVLEACGWSVDTLEFVSDTHTPKNLLIRALRSGRSRKPTALAEIDARCRKLGVRPTLVERVVAPH